MSSTAHLRINPRETSPHVYSQYQKYAHCTALIIAKNYQQHKHLWPGYINQYVHTMDYYTTVKGIKCS